MTSGASCPRLRRRSSSTAIDGGSTNIVDGLGLQLADLRGALPVDLQQHVEAGRALVFHGPPRRAVQVAVHERRLEKFALRAHALERVLSDEVVVAPVLFARRAAPASCTTPIS